MNRINITKNNDKKRGIIPNNDEISFGKRHCFNFLKIKISRMENLSFIFSGQKKWAKQAIAIFLFVVGLFVFLPSGNAQVTGVLSYNYVSKIGGRIVSSPSGLPTLPGPGQEIEYVVVVYNTGATTSGGEVIKIEIPYYADFYGASTTGSGTVNVSDAIYWTLPVLTGQGANPQAALDTLIYTLVASQDCYALNANCTQEIAVKGIVPSGWNFYYAYPPLPDSAHLGQIPRLLQLR